MKIKKVLLVICILCGILPFFCSCTVPSNGEGAIYSDLLLSFTWDEKKYIWNDETYDDVFHTFIGYFINAEDLDKWKAIDNDETIIYIVAPKNGLYRLDVSGRLSNRFEVYASDEYGTDVLGVRNGKFSVFEREERGVVSNFPTKLIWGETTYIWKEDIYTDAFHQVIGYWVNQMDLEKWKAIDSDESLLYDKPLLYVVNFENELFHLDVTGKYTNRFVIFASERYGTDVLVIKWSKITGRTAIFERVEGEK